MEELAYVYECVGGSYTDVTSLALETKDELLFGWDAVVVVVVHSPILQ